jgi:hypothetical protein
MIVYECVWLSAHAETPEEIVEVRAMKVNVPVPDEDGNIHTHKAS